MHRVIIVGLGPIGISCARTVACTRNLELAGLVDTDPQKQERPASDFIEPAPPGTGHVHVTSNLNAVLDRDIDVAVVTTTSSFTDICPLLRQLIEQKVHVVSSCEQMAWPWYRHSAEADKINAEAADAGCAILGTGVNPGFVMDTLAVTLSSMVTQLTAVRCVRRVDAALRREPLQKKIGATMSVQDFSTWADTKRIGHQGLGESVALLAAGLGRTIPPGCVHETLEPVVATRPIESALGMISPGTVAGMRNRGIWHGDDLTIELDLTLSVGLDDTRDQVLIEGPVPLNLLISNAIPGDSATVASLINQIPKVCTVTPGLRTMLDMPPAGCVEGRPPLR